MLQGLALKYWRPLLFGACVLAAFAAGRFIHPRTVTKTVTQTEWKDRIVTQVVEKEAEQKTITQVVFKDTVTHKDGTVETKEEDKTGEQDDTSKNVAIQQVSTSQGATTQTTTVTPVPAPRWFVSAGLGIPLALKLPPIGAPFVVVTVDRKLFGPFYAGVWGTSDLTKFNPALGLEIGVSF